MVSLITHLYALALFIIGLIGLVRHNQHLLMFLMCIELILLAASTNFIAFARAYGDVEGQIMVLMILTVAAAEVAIGLALLVMIFREKSSVSVDTITTLRG